MSTRAVTPDPYASYGGAVAAGGGADPYAAYGGKAQQPEHPAAEGLWHSLGAQFGLTPEAAKQAANDVKDHPIKAAIAGILGPAYNFAEGTIGQVKQSAGELGQAYQAARGGNNAEAAVHAITAVPIVGPALNKGTEQYAQGDTAGMMGTLLGASINAAPIVAGGIEAVPGGARALRSVSNLPRAVVGKTLLPSNLDTVISGDTVTPRQRYEAAKAQGVNLDTAQATNGPVATVVKKATEHSLAGSSKFEANNAANVEALHGYSEKLLNEASPVDMSREDFGNRVKNRLAQDQQSLNEQSANLYKKLDSEIGAITPDSTTVRDTAQKIVDANKDYYAAHPDLLSGGAGKAWKIVNNLAEQGEPGAPRTVTSKIVDASGNPITKEVAGKAARQDTWSDLHKLRSDLLDISRGPEMIGDRPTGWIKQLTGAVDETMTKAADADKVGDFRDANEIYKYMKQTYDDPTSRMYHIVRSPDGLTAANTLASITPDVARKIGAAAPELMPQLQRQTMNRLLRPTGNDLPDLKNLGSRLSRAQKEQLAGVLTPEQIKSLDELGRTSKLVTFDSNPSGSGKVTQKAAEGSLLGTGLIKMAGGVLTGNPAAVVEGAAPLAYSGANRIAASTLTNPAFTEKLMNAGQAAGKAAPRSVPMIPPIPGEKMEDYLKRRKNAVKP